VIRKLDFVQGNIQCRFVFLAHKCRLFVLSCQHYASVTICFFANFQIRFLQDFNVEDLLKTAHSSPLTPGESIDVDELLIEADPDSHVQAISCEELMNDLHSPSTCQSENGK